MESIRHCVIFVVLSEGNVCYSRKNVLYVPSSDSARSMSDRLMNPVPPGSRPLMTARLSGPRTIFLWREREKESCGVCSASHQSVKYSV